jgi:hypothetical protein
VRAFARIAPLRSPARSKRPDLFFSHRIAFRTTLHPRSGIPHGYRGVSL